MVGMALSPNEGLKPAASRPGSLRIYVGMALSPNEGLKLFCRGIYLTSHIVGMALSPNEGLKPRGYADAGFEITVGMALSPNEGLKLIGSFHYQKAIASEWR